MAGSATKDDTDRTTLIIGAGSTLAGALIRQLAAEADGGRIVAISRRPAPTAGAAVHWITCDYSEQHIASTCAKLMTYQGSVQRVYLFNGQLHNTDLLPEKRLEDLSERCLQSILHSNTIVPALWLARLPTLLRGPRHCVVTLLSARVGSINDNQLGGWYSYRMSKAALNMLVKTAAIEYQRRAENVSLMAYHPGTVDTPLSKPFQSRVPEDKLFSPQRAATYLTQCCDGIKPGQSGLYRDWRGEDIAW